MPNTPGRAVSNVTASAPEAPLLGGDRSLGAGADPVELRALADGQQDAVAGDRELGAGRRLGAAAAGRVGRAQLHPDELDPGDLAGLLVRDDARRAGLEDGGHALLDRLVDLVRGRHVLHVAAVDERDLGGALADRRPRAVHRREAAADDDDAAALVARVRQAERGGPQVLEAVDDAVGVLVRDAQLVGVVAADGDDDGVEALVLEVVEREVAPEPHVAAHLAAEAGDGLVLGLEDLDLGQAVLRDAVAEHAAGRRVALEDRHVVAGEQQVVGGGHARRPGADDRGAAPGRGLLLERQRRVDVLVEHRAEDLVAGVAVAVADRDRLVHLVAPAVLLARGGAHAAEHGGERDRALEDPGRLAPVGLRVGLAGSPGCRCGSGTCSGTAAGSRRCGPRRSARGSSGAAGASPRSGSGRPCRPRPGASTRSAASPRPRPRPRTSGRRRSPAAWARSTGSGSRSRCRGRPRGSSGPRGPRRPARRPRSGSPACSAGRCGDWVVISRSASPSFCGVTVSSTAGLSGRDWTRRSGGRSGRMIRSAMSRPSSPRPPPPRSADRRRRGTCCAGCGRRSRSGSIASRW